MKATLATKPIVSALDSATSALISGKSLPITTCALLEFRKGILTVSCDSLDARMSVELENVDHDEDCSFVVPPKLLKASLRGDETSLNFDGSILHVQSFGKTKLATIPAVEFPKPWAVVDTVEVDTSILTALLATYSCTLRSRGDTSECVLWDKENGALVTAYQRLITVWPADLGRTETFILHHSALAFLLSEVDEKQPLYLGKEGGILHFKSGNKSGWMLLWDGQFVKWKLVMEDAPVLSVFQREEFLNGLSALMEFVEPDNRKVVLSHDGEKWALTASHNGNEASINIMGGEPNSPDPICFSLEAVQKIIRFWTCDDIALHVGRGLTIKPVDGSNCSGTTSLIRTA